jgi:hypothetical protein
MLYSHLRLCLPCGLFSIPHQNPIYMILSHSSNTCCRNYWNDKERCRTTCNQRNFHIFCFCFSGFKYDSNVSHMFKNKRISIVNQCTHAGSSKDLSSHINPLTPELNPSSQRCLTRFFTGDFASCTVHFVNICAKNQQIQQLFIQFINYVW